MLSDKDHITEEDISPEGFENRIQLLVSFHGNNKGSVNNIEVRYHAEYPRMKVREQTRLTDEQFLELKKKLHRLDNYSKRGDWTSKVLLQIILNPHLHAIGIARLTGFEKEWLKLNIRKLNNLGLTISQKVRYEISPLGEALVIKLLPDQ